MTRNVDHPFWNKRCACACESQTNNRCDGLAALNSRTRKPFIPIIRYYKKRNGAPDVAAVWCNFQTLAIHQSQRGDDSRHSLSTNKKRGDGFLSKTTDRLGNNEPNNYFWTSGAPFSSLRWHGDFVRRRGISTSEWGSLEFPDASREDMCCIACRPK